MKISSASKKVLASALSAAMVVAFAPTVAFGAAQYDKVTVSYDVAGGVAPAGAQEVASSETLTVDNAKKITLKADAADYSKSGYKFSGWWYDANSDGKVDASEVVANKGGIDVKDVAAGSTIKLVAQYAAPTVTAGASVADNAAKANNALVASIDKTNAIAADAYSVVLSKDGSAIATANYTGATLDDSLTVKFNQAAASSLASKSISVKDELSAGKYTFTLTDTTKNVVLSTADVEVINVTAQGNGANFTVNSQKVSSFSFLAVVGQTWATAFTNAGNDFALTAAAQGEAADKNADGYALTGFKAGKTVVAAGKNGSSTETVKADQTTIAAYYAAPSVEGLNWDASANKLTLDVTSLDTTGFTYKATVTAPNGSALISDVAITDDKDVAFGSLTPALGTYKATVTATKKSDESTSILGTAEVTLVNVSFDAGEGKFATKPASAIMTSESKLAKATIEGDSYAGTNITAPTGYHFKAWGIDGTAVSYDKSGNLTVGTGTDNNVKLTAIYEANTVTQAKAPAYAYANGKVTLSTEMGSDYKIVYNTNNGSIWTDYNAAGTGITVDATAATPVTVYAKVVAVANPSGSVLAESDVLAVTAAKTEVATFDNSAAVKTYLAATTSDSKASAYKYYNQVLPNAKKAGEDAIKAVGYASAADWAKVQGEQQAAVVKAIADYEATQIEAKAEHVVSKDGKTFTYSTAEQIEAAKGALNKIVEAFTENSNGDAVYMTYDATKKTTSTTKKSGKDDVAVTASDVSSYDYSAMIKAEVSGTATTTVKVEDYDAAQAIDAQVAKLAADYATVTKDNYQAAIDDAIDAQTAYAALTKAQQALVSEGAQETIAKVLSDATEIAQQVKDEEAAQKLADAQDQAAANLLYSKTVTAKAKVGKKAQGKSFTYKLGASESGAVATFSKTGSKYIKVSKSGKVTFSKVKASKKAKTYKAKVTVAFGNKTATKTVTYKVVKK